MQEMLFYIKGIVKEDECFLFGYELVVIGIEVIYEVIDYLIMLKEYGMEFLMDYRYLWLCLKCQYVIMKICNEIICVIYEFFNNEGFVKVDLLILIGSVFEGIIEFFVIKYFDEDVYLF